jgi:CHASE2 domain-containing sensor protein
MGKLVILNLGKGNLINGFPFITIQILTEGDFQRWQAQGSLPPAPVIVELIQHWQLMYHLIYEARVINNIRSQSQDKDIKIDDTDITHISDVDFFHVCKNLETQINVWLASDDFRKIEQQLHIQLNAADEIRFIIQTEDETVRKLPWNSWRFFQNYSRAELGLSYIEFAPNKNVNTPSHQVRILAVLGESTNIDVEGDRKILAQLPSAEIIFLTQPTREKLDECLWNKKGWDILFFAGHSYTQANAGEICINSELSLSITQLKNALKKAVVNGLKIAIFNSCDGLGLVEQLQNLNIPQIIVMREPVPDKVAQKFLKHFLNNFAAGESFYLSIRHAREKLQALESEFPCASWLPVICQNPAEISPTWDSLKNNTNAPYEPLTQISQGRRQFRLKLNFKRTFALSLIVTSLLMVARATGIFQAIELLAFDYLMQKRPLELPDKRLLIVGVDEKDIRTYGYPLPDFIIAQLVNKLKQYQPTAIGLNIVRDVPTPQGDFKGHQKLVESLRNNASLISVCAFSSEDNTIAPPPSSSIDQIGFIDLYSDDSLYNTPITRRYLLTRSDNPIRKFSPCTTKYSLAFQLAYRYFQKHRIPIQVVKDTWQINKIPLKRLRANSGNYQKLDENGNQLLINYRNTPNPQQIAQQVTLRDIMNANLENFDTGWVKNRIILIGVTAPSVKDPHYTPYGEMRSIYIHAHVVSQLLSIAEDNRPMLWWLPEWGNFVWVFFWTSTGSVIVWRVKTHIYQGLALLTSCLLLYMLCLSIFMFGGWIPTVTANIALISPFGVVWIGNLLLRPAAIKQY